MKYSYDSNGGGPVQGAGLLQLQVMVLWIIHYSGFGENTLKIRQHTDMIDTDPYNVDSVVSLSVRPPDALPLAFEGLYIGLFVILGHK